MNTSLKRSEDSCLKEDVRFAMSAERNVRTVNSIVPQTYSRSELPSHWACTHLSGHISHTPQTKAGKQKEEEKRIARARGCGRSGSDRGVEATGLSRSEFSSRVEGRVLHVAGERHLVITWMSHARTSNPRDWTIDLSISFSLSLSCSRRSSREGSTSASPQVARPTHDARRTTRLRARQERATGVLNTSCLPACLSLRSAPLRSGSRAPLAYPGSMIGSRERGKTGVGEKKRVREYTDARTRTPATTCVDVRGRALRRRQGGTRTAGVLPHERSRKKRKRGRRTASRHRMCACH